jgi:hypothetical protein
MNHPLDFSGAPTPCRISDFAHQARTSPDLSRQVSQRWFQLWNPHVSEACGVCFVQFFRICASLFGLILP